MNISDESAGASAALTLCDPDWVPDLAARMCEPVLDALVRAAHLPRELVRCLLASAGPGTRAALARDVLARGTVPPADVAIVLAALGGPDLAVRLYLAEFPLGFDSPNRFVTDPFVTDPGPADDRARAEDRRAATRKRTAAALCVRSAVLASADPADPRWREPGGLVERLSHTRADARLVPVLRGPFPESIAHALRVFGDDPTPAVRVDARRRLREAGGEDAFALGGACDAAVDAPPLDDAVFDAHLLLLGLRHLGRNPPREDRYTNDDDEGWNTDFAVYAWTEFASVADELLPWDLILAEHARRPFTGAGLAALTTRPGCPDDLADEAYRAEPYRVLTAAPDIVPLEWIAAFEAGTSSGVVWEPLLSRGLVEGRYDPDEVLNTIAPATGVFAALPLAVPGVRDAVSRLAARLGTDTAAWTAIRTGKARFSGTVRQFVESAVTGHVPEDHHITFAGSPASANSVEAAFRTLFTCAGPDVQAALIPTLPSRAVRLLCMVGGTDATTRAALLAAHGRLAALALATYAAKLSAEETAELLDRDDPEINAALYAHARLTRDQRVRVASGTDRHGRPRAVPVAESVASWARKPPPEQVPDRVAAVRRSGHPLMLRHLPADAAGLTTAPRLAMLVRLWEHGGPQDVQELLDPTSKAARGRPIDKWTWPPHVCEAARQALAAGPDAGLELLRAFAAEAARPEAVIADLRGAVRVVRPFRDESLPWPEVLRAQAEEPFGDNPIRSLLDHPDCPPEFRDGVLYGPVPYRTLGQWIEMGLDSGALTVLDVAATACVQAPQAVRIITEHAAWTPGFLRDPAFRELIRHVRGRLDRPDAWVVAVRLLHGFPGTLLELLDTAAAMTADDTSSR
ncbi:hypothetical protein [Embleya sp. MST-111070]|uniref:hypothetical protein n=1 Tax=Embleya sp. MST-111070 TaxID=3398231 RepID=UPI003F73D201